jgi:hypothetical protein
VGCEFGRAVAAGVDSYGTIIAVGAFAEDVEVPDQGMVYVFRDDGDLVDSFTTPNPNYEYSLAECNRFGLEVASADMDGDGFADVVVGANAEPLEGVDKQGRSYIFTFNVSSGRFEHWKTYDSPSPVELNEVLFGSKLALGDTDRDGETDLVVGALWDDNREVDEGLAYIYTDVRDTVYPGLRPDIERIPDPSDIYPFPPAASDIYPYPPITPVPFEFSVRLVFGEEKIKETDADWWLVAQTSSGWYYYDFYDGAWTSGFGVSYQGKLGSFQEIVLSTKGLPSGELNLYFGVDLIMNKQLDSIEHFDFLHVKNELKQ